MQTKNRQISPIHVSDIGLNYLTVHFSHPHPWQHIIVVTERVGSGAQSLHMAVPWSPLFMSPICRCAPLGCRVVLELGAFCLQSPTSDDWPILGSRSDHLNMAHCCNCGSFGTTQLVLIMGGEHCIKWLKSSLALNAVDSVCTPWPMRGPKTGSVCMWLYCSIVWLLTLSVCVERCHLTLCVCVEHEINRGNNIGAGSTLQLASETLELCLVNNPTDLQFWLISQTNTPVVPTHLSIWTERVDLAVLQRCFFCWGWCTHAGLAGTGTRPFLLPFHQICSPLQGA